MQWFSSKLGCPVELWSILFCDNIKIWNMFSVAWELEQHPTRTQMVASFFWPCRLDMGECTAGTSIPGDCPEPAMAHISMNKSILMFHMALFGERKCHFCQFLVKSWQDVVFYYSLGWHLTGFQLVEYEHCVWTPLVTQEELNPEHAGSEYCQYSPSNTRKTTVFSVGIVWG